jgi:type IV pilus biogenesis protein CpaD/CtpE
VRVDPSFLVVLVAGLLTACGTAPEVPAVPVAQTTTAGPDPVTVCVNQLTYWAEEQLRGAPDRGFDYQEMGLTGAQADALRGLVDEARAPGQARASDWLPARARTLCTEIAARPPSTGGGWP